MRRTWRALRSFIKDIPRGIRSVITWFPIIWCDGNWDYYYTFVVLRKKLRDTQTMLEYDSFVGADKLLKDVKICVALLDRLIEDDYCCRGFDQKAWDAEYLFRIMGKHILGWWY